MAYEGYESLEFERVGDVLRITMRNPRNEVNAVDAPMHDELRRCFEELKNEREARAALFTSGHRTFCVGGDFAWMEGVTPDALYEMRQEGKQMLWNMLDVELPVVVAINGHAIGLGATLALLGDVIFISEAATIADPHVSVGLVAGDGGTVLWPMAIGTPRAKQYLFTGGPLPAAEAERIGLVNEVVAADELDATAMAFAERLAAGAPLAIRYTKAAVNQLVKQAMTAAFDYATGLELVTFGSADHKAALKAIRAGETPKFEGR